MTNAAFVTVVGLILDIFGAFFLAKGVFFETVNDIVDKDGLRSLAVNSYSAKDVYIKKAERIASRCSEVLYTRVGLSLLCIGFLAQIVGQVIPSDIDSCIFVICAVSTVLLLIILSVIVSLFLNLKLKEDVAIGFIDRITQGDLRNYSKLNLPAGMPIEVIKGILKILTHKKSIEWLINKVTRK